MPETIGDGGNATDGIGGDADNLVADQPRKRGRPRKSAAGNDDAATSVSPSSLDGGTGSGTGSGDNSGDNRRGTGRKSGGRSRAEKEAPLSVADFIGILSLAQMTLLQVTKTPEVLLTPDQNELLAVRYAAAASHIKTNFLTKKQKDIGLAIAATAMVAYTQAQAFYQRKADEAEAAKMPSDLGIHRAA